MEMSVNQFNNVSLILDEKIASLDQMLVETAYLLEQKTDFLIEKIEKELIVRKDVVISCVLQKLLEIYETNNRLRPKELQTIFDSFMAEAVKDELNKLNDLGNEFLKHGYDAIVESYNERLMDVYSYLSETIMSLFSMEYPFTIDDHFLSEKTDNYISVNESSSAYLFNVNDLIFLLPNLKANKALYNRYVEKIGGEVSRNITNIISDCRYKLRESKRSFNTAFSTKVRDLSGTITRLVSMIYEERNLTENQQSEFIGLLNSQISELKKIADKINDAE